MKAAVLKIFRDKHTGAVYAPGVVLDIERERFADIREALGDSYIAEIVDPEAVPMQEEPDSGGAPQSEPDSEDAPQQEDSEGETIVIDGPALAELVVGALPLVPAFSPDITSYTAETRNNTNTVRAVPADTEALVLVSINGEALQNGASAAWRAGDNTLTVSAALEGRGHRDYTVTVTKKE